MMISGLSSKMDVFSAGSRKLLETAPPFVMMIDPL